MSIAATLNAEKLITELVFDIPENLIMEHHTFLSLILQSIPANISTKCLNTISNPTPYKILMSLSEQCENFTKEDHRDLRLEVESSRFDGDKNLHRFFEKHEESRSRMILA